MGSSEQQMARRFGGFGEGVVTDEDRRRALRSLVGDDPLAWDILVQHPKMDRHSQKIAREERQKLDK